MSENVLTRAELKLSKPFRLQPESVVVTEGGYFSLIVDCNWQAELFWVHDGDILRGEVGESITRKNVTKADSGLYQCCARTMKMSGETRAVRVTVKSLDGAHTWLSPRDL